MVTLLLWSDHALNGGGTQNPKLSKCAKGFSRKLIVVERWDLHYKSSSFFGYFQKNATIKKIFLIEKNYPPKRSKMTPKTVMKIDIHVSL